MVVQANLASASLPVVFSPDTLGSQLGTILLVFFMLGIEFTKSWSKTMNAILQLQVQAFPWDSRAVCQRDSGSCKGQIKLDSPAQKLPFSIHTWPIYYTRMVGLGPPGIYKSSLIKERPLSMQ